MEYMPTSYKVGRLVMAIWSAAVLYLVFLMAAFLVCVLPHVKTYQNDGQIFAGMLIAAIMVSGGLNSLGYYGAVYHHYKCLVIYAGIYFTAATLVFFGFLYHLPGVGLFLYVVINSSSTLIPAYMAYCIKNNHLFSAERQNLAQC
ncbi:hypothetical protein HDE_08408 [Halotydeus destructor]|nr:hypothetical protein HDE_08408 [Halotydeus destructor]